MTGVAGAAGRVRPGGISLLSSLGLALTLGGVSDPVAAQVAERNVNVIGGPTFLSLDAQKKLVEIAGDPWRNQQVEPHCAVSARNPAVILCGAVDYRLVDLPGGADGLHNDSWNMVAQSGDGGVTWASTLHPGHPLDSVPTVLSKYDFAADPIVRAGAAGVFYYAGLVAERPTGPLSPPSAIYVSTWIHLNDREDDPAPVKMVQGGIAEIFRGDAGQFRDRPDLAVGEPGGGTCTFQVGVPGVDKSGLAAVETVTQTVPATPAYVAFTTFAGTGIQTVSKIHFTKSTDCGRTWTSALKVSEENVVNQAPQIVKFPGSPRILVFWRRGAMINTPDAIMVVRSDNEGRTFTKPRVFATICPFDQPSTATTFRSRTVPSVAGDKDRAYVVWADRRDASGKCTSPAGTLNDARVVIATTVDGSPAKTVAWVDPTYERGHQIVPSVAASAGRVHVSWLDFRNDASGIFGEYVDETPVVEGVGDDRKRHTADIRAAEAGARATPVFPPSHQVSQYIVGKPAEDPVLQQLQWNVVNPRNFDRMQVVFNGDYHATVAEGLVPLDPLGSPGAWVVNGAPGSPPLTPVFHRFWTDSRNMKLISEENYYQPRPYTPPDLNSAIVGEKLPATSLFDPTQTRTICNPDETGTKNLEIYTSRSTHGFYAFAPWNNKTLLGLEEQPGGQGSSIVPVQRAFPIVVQNTLPPPDTGTVPKTPFRLTIVGPPPVAGHDGIPEMASFQQFSVDSDGLTTPAQPVLEERVAIRAGSAVARTVYVTSSDPRAAVEVEVLNESTQERRTVFLNPDPTAPPNLKKPGTDDGLKPNFDIARYEVHDLAISDLKVQDIGVDGSQAPRVADQGPEDGTPSWRNPGWSTPSWRNPSWRNPSWRNPSWRNPSWRNPSWRNPSWRNPAISDETAGGSRQVSAAYTNTGNTTSTYDARLLVGDASGDYRYQLIVYRLYTTTPDDGCDASLVGNTQVLVNIPDYDPAAYAQAAAGAAPTTTTSVRTGATPSASPAEPAVDPADTSFSLEPGETAYVVLVVTSTASQTFPTDFDAETITFQGTPQSLDTEEIEALPPGAPIPPPDPVVVHVAPLAIATSSLPNASVLLPYSATLEATGGAPPYTWSVTAGSPPGGVSLDASTGVLSGTPTSTATYSFTVEVRDTASPQHTDARGFTLTVHGSAIAGTVRWNQAPITAVTSRPAAIRAGNGSEIFPANRYDSSDGSYSIPVPPGTYDLVVEVDAAAPYDGKHLAGDYWGYVSSIPVATGVVTVNPDCGELIHFTSPVDTGQVVGASPPPYPVYASPLLLNWVPVAGAARYAIMVYVGRDDPWARQDLAFAKGDIGGPPFALSMPDSLTNQHYEIEFWAYNSNNTMIGRTMIEYSGGYGWDYRFKMLPPQPVSLVFLDAPGTAVAGQAIPAVRVQALDATAAPLAGASLTMTLGTAACAGSTLSGGTTAITGADGVATFSTLSLDRGGFAYTLRASATGNPSITALSASLNVEGFCTTGSLAGQRVNTTATPLPDGTVLITGGFDGTSYLSDALLYDPVAGGFTATGSMATPRGAHAATLLPNGKVLITGGYAGPPTGMLNTAEIYDPATRTFITTAGAMDSPHMMHTATLLPNGKVLIYGPVGGPNPAELYDPASETFSAISPPSWSVSNPTATLLPGGTVLFVGGGTSQAWLYDMTTGFSATGSMAVTRQNHTATLLHNGRVLVAGGWDGAQSLASAELYDPSTGTFSPSGAALTVPRYLHATARLPSGKVLIAAGFNSGTPVGPADVYDPVLDRIDHTVSAVIARDQPVAAPLADGTVLVCCGSPWPAEIYFPVDPPFAAAGYEAAGTMVAPRAAHSASPLPGGRLLVVGGVSWTSTPLDSAEVYDPLTASFAVTGSLSTTRWDHTATPLPDGRILIAGGAAAIGSYLDTAEIYDPVSGFTATGRMTVPRALHTATLLPNGKVLIVGGINSGSGTATTTAEIYDPATGTFSATGSLLAWRARHTATLLPNGRVLIAGSDQSGVLSSAELYDPATGTFAWTGSMATPRHYHSASLLSNGKVLVAGGWDGNATVASTEVYDPVTGTFSPGGAMSAVRRGHTATALPNGKILVMGGEGAAGRVLSSELYDPASNSFSLTSPSTGRVNHTATLLFNGKVLIAGGGTGAALFGTVELYRPGP